MIIKRKSLYSVCLSATLGISALLPYTAYAAGELYTRTPAATSFSEQTVNISLVKSPSNPFSYYSCEFNGGSNYHIEITDSNANVYSTPTVGVYTPTNYNFTSLPVGSYVSVIFVCNQPAGNHDFNDTFTITATPPPPFSALITNADSGFSNTTGTSVGAAVMWSADNLIKVFIGSGLALLYALRLWIVALIMLGLGIYFSYQAFRFFRH
jgi:hypothetical protein